MRGGKAVNKSDNELVEQHVDFVIKISILNKGLQAIINIEPPRDGGMPPNLDSIRAKLDAMNIKYGINEKTIRGICNNPVYNRDIVIAEGARPVNGKDGSYKILFQTDRDMKPKEREDGTVDFHDLEIVENVKKGQVLCTIEQPTEGIPGTTVTGDKISSLKGKSIPNLLGKNTKFNDDKTAILSTIDGQVYFTQNRIFVNETLVIHQDVDNSTGHIKAIGNVIINGAVLPGFIVEAEGNIEVKGNVNSATLKAGGNIILRNGAVGSKVYCEGDLTIKFVENSSVFVKGNMKAAYIMNSSIKCGKTVQTVGSISKIVGGICIAGENIEARTIGSVAAVKTHLELGTDSTIIERQQELLKELPELDTKIKSLQSLISLLQQYQAANRLTPEKKQILDNALSTYRHINASIIDGKQELEKITESIKSKGYGRIVCSGTIYPGTTAKIGSMKMKFSEPMLRKSLYYTEEGIAIGTVK